MNLRNLLFPLLLGILLSWLFWPTLWQGGGLIGGDTYTYFFPQKAFFADHLRQGEFPFWNNLVGHGYPLIGESQTAALHPLNWILYGMLDLNSAYNASHLLHYIIAFAAMWGFARRLGQNRFGAALAALVYVYGWFPPRACLEWAIIGGVYLPIMLWCVESYFQTFRFRYLGGLSLTMALNLLAGHFHLAFISTLMVTVYALFRGRTSAAREQAGPADVSSLQHWKPGWIVILFCGLGYAMAGPQLVPSWDLKRASQRTEENAEFDPGYGHIPPWYLIQTVTPWIWYSPQANPDEALNSIKVLSIPSLTNKVEAHLYFGLLPLGLAFFHLLHGWRTGRPIDRRLKILGWLGLFGLIYATGWLVPVAKHLPGFGFFRGPGRYGIIPTLAVALFSGAALTRITAVSGSWFRPLLAASLLVVTTYDLWSVRQHQWYTYFPSDPPINHRDESAVARLLNDYPGIPRMYAHGPNLATLTRFAATPPYLGFGPDAYYEPGGKYPKDGTVAERVAWLRQAGVTHILSESLLSSAWPVTLEWSGIDRLLNPAWARRAPLFLYSLKGSPGRAWLEAGHGRAQIESYTANRVVVSIETDAHDVLVLADLPWHEWKVTRDGEPVSEQRLSPSEQNSPAARLQRKIPLPPGRHTVIWTYQPRSFYWGVALALAAAAVALSIGLSCRGKTDSNGQEPDADSSCCVNS